MDEAQQQGCFQSPPREGRIGKSVDEAQQQGCFQSPPREGRIGKSVDEAQQQGCFQSPPREGRIFPVGPSRCFGKFPVTSPRGEDPDGEGELTAATAVSSHLPARGGSWC